GLGNEAVPLAVLADESDSRRDRFGRMAKRRRPDAPRDDELSGNPTAGEPEERRHEGRPPGPHEPGDSEDLALAGLEGNSLEDAAARVDRILDAPVLNGERGPPGLRRRSRVEVANLAPDHRGDRSAGRPVRSPLRRDRPAIAKDRDPIRDREDFFQAVADVDRGDAAVSKPADEIEKSRRVPLR